MKPASTADHRRASSARSRAWRSCSAQRCYSPRQSYEDRTTSRLGAVPRRRRSAESVRGRAGRWFEPGAPGHWKARVLRVAPGLRLVAAAEAEDAAAATAHDLLVGAAVAEAG